jgi:peptide-methionine (R)-S-oxide reductase
MQWNVKKNVLDKTHGMIRTEIVCANCGGHLDTFLMIKQEETWLCNSLSIDFKEIDDKRS